MSSESASDPHLSKNLFQAILLEQNERIGELLDPSTNNFILLLKQTDELGRTALYFAAQYGKTEIVKRFIATAAVDIDASDNHGWTPLFIACLNGHIEVARILVEHSATLGHVEDEYGWTPIYAAIANNHIDVLRFLVSNKVNVNMTDSLGRSPLWLAASLGHTSIVVELLANTSVNVNTVDKFGRTPLYITVQNEHFETLVVLVEGKCDLSIADMDGRTPLALAETLGHSKIQDYLVKNNAPHEVPDVVEDEPVGEKEFKGEFVRKIATPRGIKILCMTQENGRIWGGGSDGSLLVWDIESGELLVDKEKAHSQLIHALVADGKEVWALSEDDDLSTWKYHKGSQSILFADSGRSQPQRVFTAFKDKEFPPPRMITLQKLNGGAGNESVVSRIASAGPYIFMVVKNDVFVFDEKILSGPYYDQYALKATISNHSDQIKDVVYSNNLLYTASKDVSIQSYSLEEEKVISVQENPGKVYVTNFIELSNNQFASCGYEKVVRIWDDKLKLVKSLDLDEHHTREVMALCWSNRKGRLWLSSLDKHLSLWQ